MPSSALRAVLAIVGALAGGAVGHLVFLWMVRQGFYGLILPGALLGAGCGAVAGTKSNVRGIMCGVAGLVLGTYSEWSAFPFAHDESFGYFVTHLHELRPVTLFMIGLGGLFAYWFGRDAFRGPWPVGKRGLGRDV